jgi:hypothetical protein
MIMVLAVDQYVIVNLIGCRTTAGAILPLSFPGVHRGINETTRIASASRDLPLLPLFQYRRQLHRCL